MKSTFILTWMILVLFCTGCSSKNTPRNLPPKPSPAQRSPINDEPLARTSLELVEFGTWKFRPEKATPEHIAALEQYMSSIAWTETQYLTEREQEVFWVNAFNAGMMLELLRGKQGDQAIRTSHFIAGQNRSLLSLREQVKYAYPLMGGVNGFPRQIPTTWNLESLLSEASQKQITAAQPDSISSSTE